MGYIYISYAIEDADKVTPLADAIRAAGWSVRFGPLVEPAARHRRRVARDIAGARALVAIWSRHSVEAERVRDDAQRADELGSLVSVRLEDVALAIRGRAVIDLFEGADASHVVGSRAILDAIAFKPLSARPPVLVPQGSVIGPEVLLSIRGAHTGPEAPRPASGRRGRRLVLGATLLVGLALTALGGLSLAGVLGSQGAGPELAAAEPSAGPMGASSGSGATLDLAAIAHWERVDKDDPLALRAFLASYGKTRAAEWARSALLRLERLAWQGVETAKDAASALSAVDAYRSAFGDGRYLEQASAIEREQSARIADAQGLLQEAGFAVGMRDGVPRPATVEAVKAFQTAAGLGATGLIDPGLIEALRARSAAALPGEARGVPDLPAGPSAAKAAPDVPKGRADVLKADVAIPAAAQTNQASARASAPFRDCYVCPQMVALPPGEFLMGDATGKAEDDEGPVHRVRIDYRLAVGRTEVTFEEWDACVADGACQHRPADRGLGRGAMPVVDINPADVKEFLGWLGGRTGKRYRLLSEAEWEYAARAGAATAWVSGNDPSDICRFGNGADAGSSYAWRNPACTDRWAAQPAPVASFTPNAFGLHDMLGNVWEWTADCWHPDYRSAPSDGGAWTTRCEGADLVLRGGAYSVDIDKLRLSYRYHYAPRRMPFFGLRVARVLD